MSAKELTPLNKTELEEVFGVLPYAKTDNSSIIIISPEWRNENLSYVYIPQLSGIETYGGRISGKIYCNNLIHYQLKRCFEAIEKAGILQDIIFWGGCFEPRTIRGNNTEVSRHSYGIALDINPQQNPLGIEPPGRGKHGTVVRLNSVFKRFGFCWGGNFPRKDGMHFECCKIIGGGE